MTEPAAEKKPRAKKAAKPAVEAPVAAPAPRRSEIALQLKRTLSQGDSGPFVQEVQRLLTKAGFFEAACDGHYGSRMARSVRQFQSANGVRVTGDVNANTWEVLVNVAA